MIQYTIYDHPLDFPNCFVARKWIIGAECVATDEIIGSASLDEIRRVLADRGLVCIARSPEDDPKIVETWL